MTPFAFIGPNHIFNSEIACLREAIAADPANSSARFESRSLLRIDFDQPTPLLKWAYVSRRPVDSFQTTTYLYRQNRLGVQRFEFPNDPKLPGLNRALNLYAPAFELLRYIPRRRLTVKTQERVAKFVRPAELMEVVDRLKIVQRRAPKPFRIPMLSEVHSQDGVFFQQLLSGTPLSVAVTSSDKVSLLENAGIVGAAIHKLSPDELPRLNRASLLQIAQRDYALISLFRPDLKAWLGTVVNELARRFSEFTWEPAFCHGDFRAPHVLLDGALGVIDFDGAACAEPHWEHALFITSLKRELPILMNAELHEAAAEAYLRGYEKEGPRVNREKLRWFRLAAEIHFLARSFQRDLCKEPLLAQSIEAIAKLSGHKLP